MKHIFKLFAFCLLAMVVVTACDNESEDKAGDVIEPSLFDDVNLEVTRNKVGIITRLRCLPGFDKELTPSVFFNELLKGDTTNTFVQSKKGEKSETYEHYYNGVKVMGGLYVFHYDENHAIELIHGGYYPIEQFNSTPDISDDEAAKIFADYMHIPFNEGSDYSSELSILPVHTGGDMDTVTLKLVYRIFLYVGGCDKYAYINAHTGDVELVDDTRDY